MPLAKVQAGVRSRCRGPCVESWAASQATRFQSAGHGAVEIRVLPRRSLAELLDRYRVAGEIDPSRDRAVWQAAASQDAEGNILGFSVLRVSSLADKPLEVALT